MPMKGADALLFDLGRVVIDIDFERAFACWAGHARCEPRLLQEEFRRDVSHRRHEVGEIDTRVIEDVRRNWPFLRDRRIDSYAPITSRMID